MSKTILITGSTDGIGKLAAIKLAKEGHEIYLHGRNAEKLNSVISEVITLSNNDKVKGYVADFSELESVKAVASQINLDLTKVDILINNAGVFKSQVEQTNDGFDIRFAVNYLAPCILTHELLPLLQAGSDARIINLSSAAQAPVSLDALSGKTMLSAQESYAQSKLALTMFSFFLAKEMENINVIALNPGSLLNTKMVREAYGRHWSGADKGADIIYDLAISDKYIESSGKYFDNDRGAFGEAHADAYNDETIEALISETDRILSKYST